MYIGSKNTTVIFLNILEGNILGYASYIRINPMLLSVKNLSAYISMFLYQKLAQKLKSFSYITTN